MTDALVPEAVQGRSGAARPQNCTGQHGRDVLTIKNPARSVVFERLILRHNPITQSSGTNGGVHSSRGEARSERAEIPHDSGEQIDERIPPFQRGPHALARSIRILRA